MGVIVGLKNIYVAKLLTDTSSETTYEAPQKLAKAISANIQPTTNSAKLYADDDLVETMDSLGEITVEIGIDQLPTDMQELLLGHTVNSEGVLVKKATDQAPYVALGFESPTSDGKQKLVWFYKGKFRLPNKELTTKGESPEYKTRTLSGTFMRRDSDKAWEVSVNSGDAGVTQTVIDNWFTAVYEETVV